MEEYHPLLILVGQEESANSIILRPEETTMSKNNNIRSELRKMSKEKLIWQIEQLQKDLEVKSARALKYYSAFNYLMEHFDSLHDEDKPKLDKRLKEIGL